MANNEESLVEDIYKALRYADLSPDQVQVLFAAMIQFKLKFERSR